MSKRRRTADIEHQSMGSVRRSRVDDMQSKLDELEEEEEDRVVIEEEPLNPEVRSSLRELIFLGRIQESVEFSGYKFILSTLSNSETKELIMDLSNYEVSDRVLAIRPLALARSIISVNDLPLEKLYAGSDNGLSVMERRIDVINNWQTTLVNVLFEKYEELLKKSGDIFSSGTLGDDIKK